MAAEEVVRELIRIWNDGSVEDLDRVLAPMVDHDGRLESADELAEWHRREEKCGPG